MRRVIDEVQAAALNGFQFNNPDALDNYFATVQEGAVVTQDLALLKASRG